MRFLSDDVENDSLETLRALDKEISLLQEKSPSINNSLFKQRSSWIGLKSKESGENVDYFKSVSNKLFLRKQLSQADHKPFSTVDTDQPYSNNLSNLAQTPSNTGAELMTSSLSLYNELKKRLGAFKRLHRSYTELLIFGKKHVQCWKRR